MSSVSVPSVIMYNGGPKKQSFSRWIHAVFARLPSPSQILTRACRSVSGAIFIAMTNVGSLHKNVPRDAISRASTAAMSSNVGDSLLGSHHTCNGSSFVVS